MLVWILTYLGIGVVVIYGLTAFLALPEDRWFGLPSQTSYSIRHFLHDVFKSKWDIESIVTCVGLTLLWPVTVIIFPILYKKRCKEQKELDDMKAYNDQKDKEIKEWFKKMNDKLNSRGS